MLGRRACRAALPLALVLGALSAAPAEAKTPRRGARPASAKPTRTAKSPTPSATTPAAAPADATAVPGHDGNSDQGAASAPRAVRGPLMAVAPGAALVAVVPLRALGVSAETTAQVGAAVLKEIGEVPGLQPAAPAQVATALAAAGLPSDCGGDLLCLARIGRALGAQRVLDLAVAGLGDALNVAVRLIDVTTGTQLQSFSEGLPVDPLERTLTFRRLAVRLFLPAQYTGGLELTVEQPGADVYLDDAHLGRAPLAAPVMGLVPGPHVLRVSKAGFMDFNAFVTVEFNKVRQVQVSLGDNRYSETLVALARPDETGELVILVAEAGLELRLDGEPIGYSPLGRAVIGIPVGARRLALYRGTERVVNLQVEVRRDQRAVLELPRGESGALAALPVSYQAPSAPLPRPAWLERELAGATAAASAASAAGGAPQGPAAGVVAPVPGPTDSWLFWGGLSASTALAVAGGVAGYLALDRSDRANRLNDLARDPATPPAERPEYREVADAVAASRRFGYLSYGALGVAGLGAALLGTWLLLPPPEVAAVGLAPALIAARPGLVLTVTR